MSRWTIGVLIAASYGSVLMLASLAVIGVSDVTEGHGVELVGGVGLATWIAHLFAELLGEHIRHDEPVDRTELARRPSTAARSLRRRCCRQRNSCSDDST